MTELEKIIGRSRRNKTNTRRRVGSDSSDAGLAQFLPQGMNLNVFWESSKEGRHLILARRLD